VKMPGYEEPLSIGMAVRQTSAELSHINQWILDGQILTAAELLRSAETSLGAAATSGCATSGLESLLDLTPT